MNKLHTLHVLGLCTGLLTLSACGDKADKVGDGFKLQGDYQSEGRNQVGITTAGIGCVVHNVSVKALQMKFTQTLIAESNCSGKPLGTVTTETSLNIGNELNIAPNAREMDLKIKKSYVTPLQDGWLSIFGVDATKDCDVSKAPLNQPVDVTGKDCGLLGQFARTNEIYYGSFQLKDRTLVLSDLPKPGKHIGSEVDGAPRDVELRLTLQEE